MRGSRVGIAKLRYGCGVFIGLECRHLCLLVMAISNSASTLYLGLQDILCTLYISKPMHGLVIFVKGDIICPTAKMMNSQWT